VQLTPANKQQKPRAQNRALNLKTQTKLIHYPAGSHGPFGSNISISGLGLGLGQFSALSF